MKIKAFMTTIMLIFTSIATCAAELTLDIDGYRSNNGGVMISVFNDPSAYQSGEGAIISVLHPAIVEGHRITFSGLAEGDYAVKIFHDENGNGELDTNLLGIPTESYGFSGGSSHIGPPSFDQAKLRLESALIVNFNLR